jgi:signal transduction histidine kinase
MFTNTGNEERKGIERMGGSVEVRSRLGQGSQFSLCLQRRD